MLISSVLLIGVGLAGGATTMALVVAIPFGLLCLLAWIILTILSLFGYNPQMKDTSPKGAWIGPCPKCGDQVVSEGKRPNIGLFAFTLDW